MNNFFKIFDSNPVGMIISNLESTKFQYVNDIFLTSFGYKKEEVIGKTALEFNLIESESNKKVLYLLKKQGFVKNIEVLSRKKNGDIFWTLASVQVVTLNNEKLAFTSFLDISDRKNAEEELFIANKELIFQNEEKEKRAAELVIANIELEYQNEEKEKRAKELVIANTEFVFQDEEKQKRILELYNLNIELVKTQHIVRKLNEGLEDTIGQRTSELIDSNKIIFDYKFALDESCIFAITDIKGTIQYVNDKFCKISKYTKEELIGQNHSLINSGYHSKEFFTNMWETINQGNVWRAEIKNKAKDDTLYWVDTTIVPFLNESGRPNKFIAIRSDITERKYIEENIIKLNENLEMKVLERTLELTESLAREKKLSELKSSFVSMASHEFRTPLTAILSSVSLIEQYAKEELIEKRNKHIKRIISSVQNLVSILNDFLSLDKLEQGKVQIQKETFDLYEFSSDILEEVKGMLKQGQEINFSLQGEKEICQDKRILRNVLLNLLSNAIKYSEENKEIYFIIEVKSNIVSIKVKDEGIGIPVEDQKHLFSKFFRAKNAAYIQGTGLGLNIVQKYLELLNGSINFISIPMEGTTFIIDFPQK